MSRALIEAGRGGSGSGTKRSALLGGRGDCGFGFFVHVLPPFVSTSCLLLYSSS